MFKNRSFQKAILVLAIVALLAGTAFIIQSSVGRLYTAIQRHSFVAVGGLPSSQFNAGGGGQEMAIVVAYPRCGYRC